MIRLDDTVAVVTGAAQGIGEGIAITLGRLGAGLVVVDRNAEMLERTVEHLRRSDIEVESVYGDVRDQSIVDATVAAATERFGRLDTLVNNVGGGFWAAFDEVSAKGEAALIAENFTQVTAFVRAAVPSLSVQGGSIINITSVEAHRAGPGFAIYSAMKAAVANLSKSLALELAPRGIRVNCIAPDMIPTPGDGQLVEDSAAMSDGRYLPTPLGAMGNISDVGGPAAFLASDLSRFVTGTTIHVDGGTLAASGWRRRASDDAWVL